MLATAAARDASNGAEFLAAAAEAIGAPVSLLSGDREAELSALWVISGIHKPDGVVGDLGGGSLELIDVKGSHAGKGASLPLGGLTLMDASGRSPRAAVKIVRESSGEVAHCRTARRAHFLCGRRHLAGPRQAAYEPAQLSAERDPWLCHPVADAADFAGLVERVNTDTLISIDAVSAARRPLLAYGAVVLDEIIRRARPLEIMISTAGVREGFPLRNARHRRNAGRIRCSSRRPNSISFFPARPAMPRISAIGPTAS